MTFFTCIWISLDFCVCLCCCGTEGKRIPACRASEASCRAPSCSWPTRRWSPATLDHRWEGTSPCRGCWARPRSRPRLSRWPEVLCKEKSTEVTFDSTLQHLSQVSNSQLSTCFNRLKSLKFLDKNMVAQAKTLILKENKLSSNNSIKNHKAT